MASVIRRHFPSMLANPLRLHAIQRIALLRSQAKDGRLPPSVENELVSIVMDKIEVGGLAKLRVVLC